MGSGLDHLHSFRDEFGYCEIRDDAALANLSQIGGPLIASTSGRHGEAQTGYCH